MTKVVLDTNVVVSAALSPRGNPAKIISYIAENVNVQLFISADIVAEYRRVLAYEHLKLAVDIQDNILETTQMFGVLIEPTVSSEHMPDESDRIFYDAAVEADAIIVTGNLKHYPDKPWIMNPTTFLEYIGY